MNLLMHMCVYVMESSSISDSVLHVFLHAAVLGVGNGNERKGDVF